MAAPGGGPQDPFDESLRGLERAIAEFQHAMVRPPLGGSDAPADSAVPATPPHGLLLVVPPSGQPGSPCPTVQGVELVTVDMLRSLLAQFSRDVSEGLAVQFGRDLSEGLAAEQGRLEQLEQRVDRALERCGDLASQMRTVEGDLERVHKELQGLACTSQDADQAEEDVSTAQSLLDDLRQRIEDTEERIQQISSSESTNYTSEAWETVGIGNRLSNAKDGRRHEELIQAIWYEKGGDILDELCHNLRRAGKEGSAAPLAPEDVARVCQTLQSSRVRATSRLSSVSLVSSKTRKTHFDVRKSEITTQSLVVVCWKLYTMMDVDIDRLFGFECEPLPENMTDPKLRDQFYDRYRSSILDGDERNPQMFQEANAAMRVSFDMMSQGRTSEHDAQVRKWVKWICVFGASSCKLISPVKVSRGLTGLPESLINDLVNKKPGDTIYWPSPSSTTDDPEVSNNYCMQKTPVIHNVIFTVSSVHEALPMFAISEYIKEREYLLPPFSLLEVLEVRDNRPHRCVEVDCVYKSCLMSASFRKECGEDLDRATSRLREAAEKKERLVEKRERSIASVPGAHGLDGIGAQIYARFKADLDKFGSELDSMRGKFGGELSSMKARLRQAGSV